MVKIFGADMNREKTLGELIDCGVVAVIRAPDPQQVRPLVDALLEGGVTGIEVTMSTPNAVAVINELAKALSKSNMCLGAGTVLDADTCAAVIHAGARFVVSPVIEPDVIETTRRLGALSIPGAYTPTEIFQAWNAGADVVKVFPATTLGPGYFKDLLTVMPPLKLTPTGGVDVKTAGAWIAAGAVAVGAGSTLISKAALAVGDFAAIREMAKQFVQAVKAARDTKKG
jgi:2-dehydro-3-deoxyphosphogluconate aldolase / (4S)-4-hydroxy-2-oxoglutarate aldolase